jgi:hypothetical protein
MPPLAIQLNKNPLRRSPHIKTAPHHRSSGLTNKSIAMSAGIARDRASSPASEKQDLPFGLM